MSLSQVHGALANACLLFSLIIAGYGFLLYFRKRGVDANFLGALAAGELLFLAQGVLGVVLLLLGLRPARPLVHILYGMVQVIALPGTYAYTHARETRREVLIYALIGLFLAGISLRAMATATTVLPGG